MGYFWIVTTALGASLLSATWTMTGFDPAIEFGGQVQAIEWWLYSPDNK